MIEVIKMVLKPYRDYLMLLINDFNHPKSSEKEYNFFVDLQGVQFNKEIRILDFSKKLERFKFIGQLEANTIDYFIQNYLYRNLKYYHLNEELENDFQGIFENHNFKSINGLKKRDNYHLILVYSGYDRFSLNEKYFEIVEKFYNLLNPNQINFGKINHDKNSVENSYIDDVP